MLQICVSCDLFGCVVRINFIHCIACRIGGGILNYTFSNVGYFTFIRSELYVIRLHIIRYTSYGPYGPVYGPYGPVYGPARARTTYNV